MPDAGKASVTRPAYERGARTISVVFFGKIRGNKSAVKCLGVFYSGFGFGLDVQRPANIRNSGKKHPSASLILVVGDVT